MLDHVRVMVGNIEASTRFYERTLAPLGYRVWHQPSRALVGLGPQDAREEPRARFWLREGDGASNGILVSLTAERRELVDAFHLAGIAAGGADGGAPALREFHPSYYSASIIDPNGVTLEAVCHRAP